MVVFDRLWALWLFLFVLIEAPAAWLSFHGQPGGTLSEHIWSWLALGQPLTPAIELRRLAIVCGGAWLAVHLTTRWV